MDPQVWQHIKVVLAFVSRTTALAMLFLLYWRFSQARGPFARYFRDAFAAFCFLLLWVWIGSVAELVRFIDGASATIELGANYIFIPNTVITIWLGRLLWKFRDSVETDDHGD